MKWGYLFLSLMLSVALLAGCGESETVKEIRKARKAGNPARALEIAQTSLNADPDQMAVWCQLAHANLDYVRLTRDLDDPFIFVLQSALMCATLEEYEGELPRDWEALKSIARGQVIAKARGILDRIDDSHREAQLLFQKKLDEGFFDQYPQEVRSRMIDDYQKNMLKISSQPMVDPQAAREIVWKAGCYSELLKLLTAEEREDVRITQDYIDVTLREWPSYSELDPSFITDIRAEAVSAVTRVYQSLLNDLEQSDHFTVQNVLKMDILP
ncbi:hypothetical protein KKH18_13055 [bacterium]|nr:hypothetical protein [bacterium]